MSVRAKFYVTKIEKNAAGLGKADGAVVISLAPVYATKPGVEGNACEENAVFGKYTPSGSIMMRIDNEAAAKQFEIGASYYVDFTPAD